MRARDFLQARSRNLTEIPRLCDAADAGAQLEAELLELELPVLHERAIGAGDVVHDDRLPVRADVLVGSGPEQVPLARPHAMGGEEDGQEGEGRKEGRKEGRNCRPPWQSSVYSMSSYTRLVFRMSYRE